MKSIECIVIASKESPERLPPILSLAMVLPKYCQRTILVTSYCNDQLCDELAKAGVEVIKVFQTNEDIPKTGSLWAKIRSWRKFKRVTMKTLKSIKAKTLLWIGSGDSALALGRDIISYKYILQLHELYDVHYGYRYLLRYFAMRATSIVVPEICRAAILRSWYNLQVTPYVLPNKPFIHPRKKRLPITTAHVNKAMSELGENDKIVLYQGHISKTRDVRVLAEAVNRFGRGWRFAVMGPNPLGFVDEIRKVCPNLIYIPFIPAPFHLEVTSYAYIGVATYDFSNLNNVFCAPNKIWEYAGFGIPMLCADLPGLKCTVLSAGAGLCSSLTNSDEIVDCLLKIDQRYNVYSECSTQFYDSIKLEPIICNILSHANE